MTDSIQATEAVRVAQNIRQIPSHRALALLRGRNEGVLDLSLDVELPVEITG